MAATAQDNQAPLRNAYGKKGDEYDDEDGESDSAILLCPFEAMGGTPFRRLPGPTALESGDLRDNRSEYMVFTVYRGVEGRSSAPSPLRGLGSASEANSKRVPPAPSAGGYSPFYGLDKGGALQGARVFGERDVTASKVRDAPSPSAGGCHAEDATRPPSPRSDSSRRAARVSTEALTSSTGAIAGNRP